ncbi:MAG: glycoside hydrolase family 20 zincin-like fold domain-containing protein, partial [Acidobacteriota bacterium]
MSASVDAVSLLVPPPQHCRLDPGSFRWSGTLVLGATHPDAELPLRRLHQSLERRGVRARRASEEESPADIALGWLAELDDQAYRLTIAPTGVAIVASSTAGWHHGVATLLQWLHLHHGDDVHRGDIPCLSIEDAPDLAVRGVLLDVSRDRVPTLTTLFDRIEQLAALKINQLQLYMEHTFAYVGHERVWRDASPLTPDDIRALDDWCRLHGIELVPNQNSFGHLHRWLVHEPYRRLAECPDGVEHPWARQPEPFGLCPIDPAALEFLVGLYDQLLAPFTSRWINVGFDETLDLGQGRSATAVAERGKAAIYVDFLRQVQQALVWRGRRIQVWGDVLLETPGALDDLPAELTILIWGYEADHPFDQQAAAVKATGSRALLCPGTSAWNSFAGRTTNMIDNLRSATRSARDHQLDGVLVCDWGDHGHLQPPVVSDPGFVVGASLAWRVDDERDWATCLDRHVWRDATGTLGTTALELGDIYRQAGIEPLNGSALFYLL